MKAALLHHLYCLALVGSVLCVPLSAALGQSERSEAKSEASAPAVIRAIPLDDVSTEAENTFAMLSRIRPVETAAAELEKRRDQVDQLLEEIDIRLDKSREVLAAEPGVRALQQLERETASVLAPLAEVDADLDVDLDSVRRGLDQVEEKSAIWTATQQTLRKGGAVASTVKRVDAAQREIASVRSALRKQRNGFLAERDRLVDPRTSIERLINEIRKSRESQLREVFQRTEPPIWSSERRGSLRKELKGDWTELPRQHLAQLLEYVRRHADVLVLQLLVLLGLATGLPILGRRLRSHAVDDYDLRHAGDVFALPISMALLVSAALALRLNPEPPWLFTAALGFMALVPAARVVRALAPPAIARFRWAVLALFVVDRARGLVEALPSLDRGIFLAELIAALTFLIWALRPERLREVPDDLALNPFFRFAGAAVRASAVLFGLAIAAESAGYSVLADLLGHGTLQSAIYAFFFYALLHVLRSLFAYALVLRPLALLRVVSSRRDWVRRRLERLLEIATVASWAWVTLGAFGLDATVRQATTQLLSAELSVGAVAISLSDVLVLLLTIWLTFLFARFVNAVLNEELFPRVRLARGVPYAISSLVRYGLIVLGFLFALAAAGIEFSKLSFIAGGLGVGIGFGLQNVVNNFVSGLILLFERPFQVGDVVQVGELWGEIQRIGIRASVIKTFDGAEVVVPNGMLISDKVTNWTLSDRRRRLEVKVGVAYGTEAERVIELLLEVASAEPNVLPHPGARAFFMGFGDSSLDFMLRVWTADFDTGFETRSRLAVAIQHALREAGIEVPFPQRDLHVRSISAQAAPASAKDPES